MIARFLAPHALELAGVLVLALLVWIALLTVSRAGLKADLAEERAARAEAVAQATSAALAKVADARLREQSAATALGLAESRALEGERHVQQAEADLAAAISSGARRVHPALCAAAGRAVLPRPAAAAGPPDAAANDGARRVGAIVATARRADDTIRLCQETVRAYLKAANGP